MGPLPVQAEQQRQHPRLLRAEEAGLEVPMGHGHGGCVLVDSEWGTGAGTAQPVTPLLPRGPQRHREGTGAGVRERGGFGFRRHYSGAPSLPGRLCFLFSPRWGCDWKVGAVGTWIRIVSSEETRVVLCQAGPQPALWGLHSSWSCCCQE